MKKELRGVSAHLDDAVDDLELAELGATTGNRHAAFHLQQAAEKVATAVRLMRGLGSHKTHDIEELVTGSHRLEGLPEDDAWVELLRPHFDLSKYATTYRYPTPSGKRKSGPPKDEVVEVATKLRRLVERARSDLGT